ncbi:MAG: pentapeptide repeat-containing protein [Cyanobacteria bacterium P01_E01_bin.34]
MQSPQLQDVLQDRYSQGERDLRDLGDCLQGINLSNLHLEDCNLAGANLANSTLTQVILNTIDLGQASLQGAQWLEVSLSGCTIKKANLSHASFEKCDLRFCIFSGASFEGADLESCQIQHSVFIDATYDRTTIFPPGFDPDERGMVEIPIPSSSLPITDSEETLLSHNSVGSVLTSPIEPNVSKLSEDRASALTDMTSVFPEPTDELLPAENRDSKPIKLPPKKTFFYRGRLVEM